MNTMKLDGFDISKEVRACLDHAVEIRRDFHRHPELAFEEQWTSQRIRKELEDLSLDCKSYAETGIVAEIEGDCPNEEGVRIILRADMDALPIEEEAQCPWRSENSGCMHACGHDAHMAIMLGVARVLSKRSQKPKASIRFVFQPAEEGGRGAKAMFSEGLALEDADYALAFHVWSPFPLGELGIIKGSALASVDRFRARVQGKGSHAAVPEQSIDPIVIASQIIGSAQTIVSRRISPQKSAVLSFTRIQGGSTYNVIPQEVELLGTIRCLDDKVREATKEQLRRVGEDVAHALGGEFSLEFIGGLPVLKNDGAFCDRIEPLAASIVGKDNVSHPRALMVSEDMSLFLERLPGAMILLGCGNEEATVYPHHHPKFTLDERSIALGMELAVRAVDEFGAPLSA